MFKLCIKLCFLRSYLATSVSVFIVLLSFLAALWLIKPGELSILELRQPGAWLPVRTDEMLTFEKWKE